MAPAPLIVAFAVFASITGILLSMYYVLTYESPVTQRLRQLLPESTDTRARKKPAEGRFWQRVVMGIGQVGFGRASTSLSQRLSSAGYRRSTAAATFLGIRTIVSFGPALLILVPRISAGEGIGGATWMALAILLFGHVGANYMLRRQSAKRIRKLTETLPDALDLMVVCLESGLGLNATIARVGEERSALNDPLGDEFGQVAFEIRNGRTREDALRSLGNRNGVDDLKSLSGLIIQSDKLGASMAKTLRAHADLLRTRRRQRAEEAARKLPIKVLFPLALFLLPPLFVMILGPAFLKLSALVKFLVG
jgi:tight adherence protein C